MEYPTHREISLKRFAATPINFISFFYSFTLFGMLLVLLVCFIYCHLLVKLILKFFLFKCRFSKFDVKFVEIFSAGPHTINQIAER